MGQEKGEESSGSSGRPRPVRSGYSRAGRPTAGVPHRRPLMDIRPNVSRELLCSQPVGRRSPLPRIHPRRLAPPEAGWPPETTLTVIPSRDSAWCTHPSGASRDAAGVDDTRRIARAGKPFCGSRVIGDGVRGLRSAARVDGYWEGELRAPCLTGSRPQSWIES